MATDHGFEVWIADVHQAYLQSDELVSRPVFIKKTVLEFNLTADEALQLITPLYDLTESGDHWFETLDKDHREELGMDVLHSDPTLNMSREGGKVIGLSGTYVGDILRVGTERFREMSKKTYERFEMAENKVIQCTFTGVVLCREND